jgi:hypothetical protein
LYIIDHERRCFVCIREESRLQLVGKRSYLIHVFLQSYQLICTSSIVVNTQTDLPSLLVVEVGHHRALKSQYYLYFQFLKNDLLIMKR